MRVFLFKMHHFSLLLSPVNAADSLSGERQVCYFSNFSEGLQSDGQFVFRELADRTIFLRSSLTLDTAHPQQMQLLETKVFYGPNRWSRLATCEFRLASSSGPSAVRLSETIHRLHEMSGVIAKSFEPRQLAIDQYALAFEFEEKKLLDECIELALQLCQETSLEQTIDISPYHRRLVDLADDIRLGPSSRAILRAATARGIPFFRMNQGSLVQFGEGHLQRRTWTAETDATSAIAEAIASDKQLTRSLLESVGVNVPKGRSVADRDDAWLAALEFGLPVAVKPRNANHAVGVTLDLHDQQTVKEAYDWACQAGHTTDVLVEQFIEGEHHRLLVVGGKFVAAAKGQREYLFGDGVSNIRQLVDQVNADPRRGENYTDQLQVLVLNDPAAIELRKQGLDFDSIPEKGRQVLFGRIGDLIEDCTDSVHPSTREVAELAAQMIGLDIAGMDLVAQDISKPLGPQRGCIIEVNAGPSLTPHVQPLVGKPRPVGEAIVELLYPNNSAAKIPTLLFVNSPEVSGSAGRLALTLTSKKQHVGVATDGKFATVESWPLRRSLANYRSLLMHPKVERILIEATVQSLDDQGLLCEHVDFFVLSSDLVADASNCETSSSAMQLIRHLLEDGGNVVLVGESLGIETATAKLLQVPESRIVQLPTFEQAETWLLAKLT